MLEVNGVVGEVVDVGILVTELRTADHTVVQFANSAPKQLINHTKIRSGTELLIPLATQHQQLERVLELVEQHCQLFAADPLWCSQLLSSPVVLTTRAGCHQEEEIVLASSS